MPITITRLDERGVLLTGEGVIRPDDVSRVNSALYASTEKIKALTYQLCDYTKVTGVEISWEEMRQLAAQDAKAAESNPELKIAVVGDKDLVFGMLRIWDAQVSDSSVETQVFRTMEEARDWLAKVVPS